MFKFKLNALRGPSLNDSALDLGGRSGVQTTEPEKAKTEKKSKSRWTTAAPILISVSLSIVGQLILKRGMTDLGPISLTDKAIYEILWSIATNPFVMVGVVIYAFSVLFWLVGLSRVPLSYAYPFLSLSYVVILAASYFVLGEQVSLLRLAGVGLICGGVISVAYSE